jgi:hypothetical protein
VATYTKAQLRNRVLRELGVLAGGGETAEADDAAIVEEMIDAQHAMLERQVFVTWTTSAIPDTVYEPLALVVSARLAGSFGLPDARRQELLALAAEGMAELHTQTQARDDSTAPIRAVYY